MPNIAYTRQEVVSLRPRWDLTRDVISGDKAVKDQKNKYLPRPNPQDESDENMRRYEQYRERAMFYGVTSRTLRGMIGQVFARNPVATLPDAMDLLELDVDGGGVSLDQQARKALGHVIAFGRSGLFVDYPKTDGVVTVAQQAAGDIRPVVYIFDPWDIINWRTKIVGAKKLLTLVVLSERIVVNDDGFEQEWDNYFRVLRLDDVTGNYIHEIWYFDDQQNDFQLDETSTPTDADGNPWKEIPFTFIGCENNDEHPDLPPLYDLAVLNIAHYRNSADYEEACFIVGQPTPYFTGLTEAWVKDILKGSIQLGARAAVPLPVGGTAGLLQALPNTMPKEAMEAKERQMVALGAKLVEQSAVQRTAMEAGMEEASTTSLLAMSAKNVSHAYTAALKWCGIFMGFKIDKDSTDADKPGEVDPNEICYELNTDFDIARLAPLDQQALIASWQANAITFEEMRDNLRRGGIAYLDDDDAKEQMDAAGLDLGMPVGSPASAAAATAKANADALAAKLAAGGGQPAPAGKPTPASK